MIEFRSLAALTLAGVASFASACSSSSGSGSSGTPTKFACAQAGAVAMQSSACVSCVQTHCDSQAKAEFGSGYASADYSGGACGSWITCIAKCACSDSMCATACGNQSTACTNADQAASACAMQSCSVCQSGGGNDGGVSNSSDSGLSGVCVVQTGSTCPTANLVGCCSQSGGEICFYSPDFTAATGMQACTGSSGTWSTSQ